MQKADIVIIGAGIVGLATAYQASSRLPNRSILVLDKEDTVGHHQTGHNSGVLHSGIYYRPGSSKAVNCRNGKTAMEQFCQEQGIDYEICGKVIVAVDERELAALQKIYERGQKNGVRCSMIDRQQLLELEPHVAGVRAIHVPEAGIVNFRQVCTRLAEILQTRGHQLRLGEAVREVRRTPQETIVVTDQGEYPSKLLVNCAGLQCDRVSRRAGLKPDAKIVPFRGEYFKLVENKRHLCKNLIYPVPDPNFPFLGVHFTRMIDGSVECGPNAVLALAREGYRKRDIRLTDLWDSLTYPGFWKLVSRHWRMGMGEMWRSISKPAFVRALQRLVPEIQGRDLKSAPAGVRAQALRADGQLVDDFLIQESPGLISVLNAPSPAATASLNIGAHLVDLIENHFK